MKETLLDIINSAKSEFPSSWQSVALDWCHDWFHEKGSHYTRQQVRALVLRTTGIDLQ